MRYPLIAVLLLAGCGTNSPPELPTEIAAPQPHPPAEAFDPGVYYPPVTTRYALQLSSYLSERQAVAAWQDLIQVYRPLQLLTPIIVTVEQDGQPWIRLLAGLFEAKDDAEWMCAKLIESQHYCRPIRVDEDDPTEIAALP